MTSQSQRGLVLQRNDLDEDITCLNLIYRALKINILAEQQIIAENTIELIVFQCLCNYSWRKNSYISLKYIH